LDRNALSQPDAPGGSGDPPQRHKLIREHLVANGSVRIAELARLLRVSHMTVRRDLASLETAGIARRVHGGAVALVGPSFAERHQVNANAKARIAVKLARMLPNKGAIGMDSSSTLVHLVRYLQEHELTVVTNGLETHAELVKRQAGRTVLSGGELHPETGSLVGPVARRTCASISVQRLFISSGGVDVSLGATERFFEEAELKQAFAEHAAEVILAADSSKLDLPQLAQSVGWDQIAFLVTEQSPKSVARDYHEVVQVV